VQAWLPAVGWEGPQVPNEKVWLAQGMLSEMEALAADLPSGEAPGDPL
jgi:hypothetical protein